MVIPFTIAYMYKAFFIVLCTILSYIATQLTLTTIIRMPILLIERRD